MRYGIKCKDNNRRIRTPHLDEGVKDLKANKQIRIKTTIPHRQSANTKRRLQNQNVVLL